MLFPNTVAMATVQEHGLVALFLGGVERVTYLIQKYCHAGAVLT